MAYHTDAADGHVLAQSGMETPHRRIRDGDALDEDVAAVVGLDEIGPDVRPIPENALLDRHPLLSQLEKTCTLGMLPRISFPPSAVCAAFPRPPVLALAVAVERPSAGDRDVLFAERIAEPPIGHPLNAFVAS